jgi:BirA family biotin operon repressor/biotin-[acetyl-CoA-carboxylase] ligase
LADPRFDRSRFAAHLGSRRLGRDLSVLEETGSTNDEAWAAAEAGAADGLVIVAEAQTRGRGRAGRSWLTVPGRSLALSVLLRHEAPSGLAVLPLAAGLAVARALEPLGAAPALKWPNDVLLDGRKVAGVLCESRRAAPTRLSASDPRSETEDAALTVVIGVGVNVSQQPGDFPRPLAASAISLAMAGIVTARETVAAAFLSELERLRLALRSGGRADVLAAWSARARFWGRPVVVRTPAGEVRGTARALDADGALVLAGPGGVALAVRAGDLLTAGEES